MKKIFGVFLLMLILLGPQLCLAAQSGFEAARNSLQSAGNEAYGDQAQTDLPAVVGKVVNAFLAVLGIVLTIVIIRGGFMYMTAGGEQKKVEDGKHWIINGIIGLVIVLLAYALSSFVVSSMINATTG